MPPGRALHPEFPDFLRPAAWPDRSRAPQECLLWGLCPASYHNGAIEDLDCPTCSGLGSGACSG